MLESLLLPRCGPCSSHACQNKAHFNTVCYFISYSSVQILYANEGESKRDQEVVVEPSVYGERPSYISHKGHEFILTLYHFPSSCEICPRPLWNVFKPPPALECRRCHTKCHKDHLDRKEEAIAPCRGWNAVILYYISKLRSYLSWQ